MYSLALYRIDRFKDAKKAVYKSIELIDEPNKQSRLAWLQSRMGDIYKDSGHFHKAIEWFQKAHNTNSSEATFLIYQGVMFLRIEKFEEAIETLQKATRCEKGCIDEAFYNLGVAYLIRKKFEESLKCFEKALQIDPKFKEAKQQLKDVKKVLEISQNK